ncbi:MAG: YeeE/YedE family protein [Aerococcaceae bacterium]|nr:YeeE/YedE family protein [Aerococcaceae bacterium]
MGKSKWTQPLIAVGILAALAFWGMGLTDKLPIQLFAGVMLGYILTRSRYGFAGGVKRLYMRGEGSLTRALIVLVAVTAIVFMGFQWSAHIGGALPAYLAQEGDKVIPGTQNVYFTNIATIVGAFIFGIGMILAGGCGSGTLADLGEGEGRALIAFIFFVIGAAPGHYARWWVDQTAVGKVGFRIYLPEHFGYVGALLITLAILAAIYALTLWYENRRKREGTYIDPVGDYEDFEKPLETNSKEIKFFSYETYHKIFVERWSFLVGSFALAIGAIFVMAGTHKAWGVSTPLISLNVALFRGFIDFPQEAFASFLKKSDEGILQLLQDGGTVRNIGMFFGCAVAFLLANRFKFNFSFNKKDGLYFAFGGLLLGFGSRFALGCNLGAFYSSVTNFSMSGWVFMIFMALGGIFALKVFAGRVCTVGTLRKDQLAQLKNKK